MRWALYRVRVDLRRRWVGLLVVVLLVAAVGGATLAAVAGARRTESATERLRDAASEPHASVDAAGTDPERWDEIPRLPAVESALPVSFVYAFPEAEGFFPLLAPTADGPSPDVSRGLLVDGRRPDPTAPHEVALSEQSAIRLGVDVGDELPLLTYSPEGALAFETSDDVPPDGPPVTLDVVGIIRFTFDVQARSDDPTFTILTPAFADRHGDEIAMHDGLFLLRLRDGRDGIRDLGPQLRAAFPEGDVPVIEAGAIGGDPLDESMTVLSTGLLAFAGVAGMFGMAAIAQALGRAVSTREQEQVVLAAFGAARRDRFLDAWLPLAVAAGLGATGAVAVAWLASPLLPMGLGRRAEPDPGFALDVPVLAGGAVALAALVAAAAAALSWRLAAGRPGQGDVPAPPGRLTATLLRGRSPALAVGVGMATRPGRGSAGVPLRTAAAGVLAGVVGVVAVVVFGASLGRLLDEPARYGWAWDVSLAGGDAEELAARDDTAAVATGTFSAVVEVDGESTYGMSIERVEGSIELPIAEGRQPSGATEVAVGAATRARLDDPDRAVVRDAEGGLHEVDVVGTAMFASVSDPVPVDDGIALTPEGLARLGFADPGMGDAAYEQTLVRFADGVDPRAAVASLGLDREDVVFPSPPPEVERLEEVRGLPRVLATLLVALATVAAANALWQTVRRRRRDLAVLRAIGFDRRQVRWAMTWQACTIALVGAVVGVPLGLVLGRWAWELLARRLGVDGDWLVSWSVPLAGLGAVLAAALAGASFGSVAGRRRVGPALRVE